MISLLMNLLWLFLGGWTVALSWFTASLLMILSIVGIPWARAAFNIGLLTLWPFGSKVMERSSPDIGTGLLGIFGNIIWFVFAGVWLFLIHIFWAIVFSVTIIGIPFGIQHFKLSMISIAPIGKKIQFDI